MSYVGLPFIGIDQENRVPSISEIHFPTIVGWFIYFLVTLFRELPKTSKLTSPKKRIKELEPPVMLGRLKK